MLIYNVVTVLIIATFVAFKTAHANIYIWIKITEIINICLDNLQMYIINKPSVKHHQVDFHPLVMYWIISVASPLYPIIFCCYIVLTWIDLHCKGVSSWWISSDSILITFKWYHFITPYTVKDCFMETQGYKTSTIGQLPESAQYIVYSDNSDRVAS
jgi:hypothetical protein